MADAGSSSFRSFGSSLAPPPAPLPPGVVAEEFYGSREKTCSWTWTSDRKETKVDKASGFSQRAGEWAGSAILSGDTGGADVGVFSRSRLQVLRNDGGDSSSSSSSRAAGTVMHLATRALKSAFLPTGYPDSVTPDYLEFQLWDTLQGLSTYIRGMLSTQVLLGGFGVGQSAASTLGATFQWFVRDFTGMLGGILFAFFKGSHLDSNAKQWRLAADIINDVGMLLDLVSPLYPRAFLPMLCLGSVSRAITGTASGATRAALTQHFALRQNAADISAKEGSQETAATMAGMVLGMLLARFVADNVRLLWVVFLSLTAFHVYANYRAVKCLCLTSLNRTRTALLLWAYQSSPQQGFSPRRISRLEGVLPELWSGGLPQLPGRGLTEVAEAQAVAVAAAAVGSIRMGAPLSSLGDPNHEWSSLEKALKRYGKGNYLLVPRPRRQGLLGPGIPATVPVSVSVVLHVAATRQDQLRAYVHAVKLCDAAAEGAAKAAVGATADRQRGDGRLEWEKVEVAALQWMDKQYASFEEKAKVAGWNTEHVILAPEDWRANWKPLSAE